MDPVRAGNYIAGQRAERPNPLHYFTRKTRTSNLFTDLDIIFNFYEVE